MAPGQKQTADRTTLPVRSPRQTDPACPPNPSPQPVTPTRHPSERWGPATIVAPAPAALDSGFRRNDGGVGPRGLCEAAAASTNTHDQDRITGFASNPPPRPPPQWMQVGSAAQPRNPTPSPARPCTSDYATASLIRPGSRYLRTAPPSFQRKLESSPAVAGATSAAGPQRSLG